LRPRTGLAASCYGEGRKVQRKILKLFICTIVDYSFKTAVLERVLSQKVPS